MPVYRYPVSRNPSLNELRGLSTPEYFDQFTKKIKEIGPDVVHMHSNTRGCGTFHAEFIKKENIPIILSVHVPDFICVRGTLMKWGESICSGEMNVRECSACISQMKGIPKALSHTVNYVPNVIANQTINLNSKIGTALSINKIVSSRITNMRKLLDMSDHIISVSKWLERMLVLNGIDRNKIFFISTWYFRRSNKVSTKSIG